ncbi:unnamed protein product [Rangifer tarandus platyrhynchus]|uniref:Uncharacterized protein n=1 Tax=Rangifer tarandus platyrhynchus TaxID=3082113 RepID=A0AC59ZVS7_RANTA
MAENRPGAPRRGGQARAASEGAPATRSPLHVPQGCVAEGFLGTTPSSQHCLVRNQRASRSLGGAGPTLLGRTPHTLPQPEGSPSARFSQKARSSCSEGQPGPCPMPHLCKAFPQAAGHSRRVSAGTHPTSPEPCC